MKLLYIAYCTPYDRAFHAGGQTFNYYIKQMAVQENVEITLLSFCEPEEVQKVDLYTMGIHTHLIVRPIGVRRFIGRIVSINSKYNPYHRYGTLMTCYSAQLMLNGLKRLRHRKYDPDAIILEWTQILFLFPEIKRIYPKAKFIASEHDVTFLGIQRKAENTENVSMRLYKRLLFDNIKKREMACLKQMDLIFVQNIKDYECLICEGVKRERLNIMVPFYHRVDAEYEKKNNNILFFGQMGREENISAVTWFVENVMPKLKHLPIQFCVIGSGVTEKIKKLESENVKVIGFVDSIDEYFSTSFCFVSPLILGAGIKVKVIEALYSGITVITNNVGIEGIPARDRRDYYHCEKPDEYVEIIEGLFKGKFPKLNARQTIINNFSLETSFDNYREIILNKL